MKHIKVIALPLLVIIAFLSLSHIVRSTGSPGGRTGSPGDGLGTCTSCHGGGKATEVTGWITTDIPVNGYRPGTEYTITVRGERTGAALYGFELTAEKSNRTKTGGFSTGGSGQLQLLSGTNAITQTNQGLNPTGGSKSWTTKWTAPATGSGDITFYAAVNTANGDGGTGGDVIYSTNTKVKEQDLSGTNPLEIIAQMKIYPNPAVDVVTIETTGMDSEYFDIEILAINGQKVYARKLRPEAGTDKISLSVASLSPGTYFARVSAGKQAAQSKLIISK
jgi:hypothetical protein